MGGADLHCTTSGVTDHYALDDEHALSLTRDIISNINTKRSETFNTPIESPLYNPEDLYGIIDPDLRKPFDVREVIARIFDGSRWEKHKQKHIILTFVLGLMSLRKSTETPLFVDSLGCMGKKLGLWGITECCSLKVRSRERTLYNCARSETFHSYFCKTSQVRILNLKSVYCCHLC